MRRFLTTTHRIGRTSDETTCCNRDIALRACFGICPPKRDQLRPIGDRIERTFAVDGHHAKRLAALQQGPGSVLYWLSTRGSAVPAERAVTGFWCLRHVRAWRAFCVACPSSRPDADRDRRHRLGATGGWRETGDQAGRRHMDAAGCEALAWRLRNHQHDAH